MTVEEDCPTCNSTQHDKEQFAAALGAEHNKETARRDEDHREWVD